MRIQGRKLKSGKEPLKGILHEFSDSRTITFTEQEVGDVVDVEYQLEENEKKSMCYWWLYDLKKDVGEQDVILHLCEQWQAAYQYLNNSVLNYLLDIPIETRGNRICI